MSMKDFTEKNTNQQLVAQPIVQFNVAGSSIISVAIPKLPVICIPFLKNVNEIVNPIKNADLQRLAIKGYGTS